MRNALAHAGKRPPKGRLPQVEDHRTIAAWAGRQQLAPRCRVQEHQRGASPRRQVAGRPVLHRTSSHWWRCCPAGWACPQPAWLGQGTGTPLPVSCPTLRVQRRPRGGAMAAPEVTSPRSKFNATNIIAALAMIGTVAGAVFAGWDKISPSRAAAAPASAALEGARASASGASASTTAGCSQIFQGVQVQGGLSINCGTAPASATASQASR